VDHECVLGIPPVNWLDEDIEIIGKALKGEVSSCSECEFFSDTQFYADNSILVSWGSCMKCQRNMTTTDPFQEIPTWCPLKGDKDEKESTSQSNN
jgi:hypothetical protein